MLVDTSVWIELFAKRSSLREADKAMLHSQVEDGLATTVWPIMAELLSGKPLPTFFTLFSASITFVDPNWNDPAVWQRASQLGQLAHRSGLRVTGLVDRMIVVAAERAGETLWTLDADCRKIARLAGVPVR